MVDEFMVPVKEHIFQHVIKHHTNWGKEIGEKEDFKSRVNAAKKLVRMAVRETKDPYMRSERDISAVAAKLYFKAKEKGYF